MVKILLYKDEKDEKDFKLLPVGLLEEKLELLVKELNIPYYEMKEKQQYSYVKAKIKESYQNNKEKISRISIKTSWKAY